MSAELQIGDEDVEPRLVGRGDEQGLPEPPLALRRFGLQEVTLPPAVPLELAGRGPLEPLGGGALRLHLGHDGAPFLVIPPPSPRPSPLRGEAPSYPLPSGERVGSGGIHLPRLGRE